MAMLKQKSSAASRWNSHVFGGPPPTAKISFDKDTGILQELQQLSKKLGLGEPIYKIAGGTAKGRGYFCSVHVYGHQTGSLVDYPTAEQARIAAAKNAVNLLRTYYADKLHPGYQHLSKDENNVPNNESESDNNEQPSHQQGDDFERVVENLLHLLERAPRGLYSHAVSSKYLETYKQNLPPDWLIRIKEGYPEFVIDEVDSFRSIVAKRIVITPRKQQQGATSVETPLTPDVPTLLSKSAPSSNDAVTEKTPEVPAEMVVPVPKANQVVEGIVKTMTKVRFSENPSTLVFKRHPGEEDDEIIRPPPIESPPPFDIPETEDWKVFVSVVKTPSEFTVRLLGEEYSEDFEQLLRDMLEFYETKKKGQKLQLPSDATGSYESFLGKIYAARAEECWHRVCLHEIIPADEGIGDDGIMASVYFIDHGDIDTIPFDDLRVLEQNFMRLPVQATQACLAGFEKYDDENYTPEMLAYFRDLTLGKICPATCIGIENFVQPYSQCDGNESEDKISIERYLLKLSPPLEIGNNQNENENVEENGIENSTPAENPKTDTPDSTLTPSESTIIINDVILQMAANSVSEDKAIGNTGENMDGRRSR